MPIVEPTNLTVKDLEGLHVYHSGVSNCSMRVCMTLEEKGLPWTSHHLNILRKEHITPEYFGINPNGLVPTLVHDGKVMLIDANRTPTHGGSSGLKAWDECNEYQQASTRAMADGLDSLLRG